MERLFLFTGFVHQYLCLVPQDRKFCSRLISEIIWQSARWTPNFSAVKAAAAFEAIEKYAANLLNQPWRKEFKEIKVSDTSIGVKQTFLSNSNV